MKHFVAFLLSHNIQHEINDLTVCFGNLDVEKISKIVNWQKEHGLGFLFHDKFLGLKYKFWA